MSARIERFHYYEEVSRERSREPLTPQEREDFEGFLSEVIENAEATRSNGQCIGSGEIADVFTGLKGSGEENICLKYVARHPLKATYTNNLETEMRLQTDAFDLLQKEEKSGTPMAKIPQPVAYLKTDAGGEYLAMERVHGKTLYRILLERLAEQMPETLFLPGMRREDIPGLSDEDMERMVVWDYLNAQHRTSKELYSLILKRLERDPFLSADVFEKVRNAIGALNTAGFFHRDLHEKNIMLTDDLSDAYLIDFGSSSHGEHSSAQEAFETEKWGESIKFLDDKYILHVLRRLTVPRARA